MKKFTEAQLEHVFAELLEDQGFPHLLGEAINRSPEDTDSNRNSTLEWLSSNCQVIIKGASGKLQFNFRKAFM
ncbi:hypothetical protein [Formosa sp. A9]|uniref:hypothetical protein n=1 Tax=Formosa sp. A9 TaxID=3442641 RepID=UPI003EBC78F4